MLPQTLKAIAANSTAHQGRFQVMNLTLQARPPENVRCPCQQIGFQAEFFLPQATHFHSKSYAGMLNVEGWVLCLQHSC